MAFKIGNETYNRIYVSNDKNNLQQNLATSLTFGDNNVTTFRDSNTFGTPSIWAYDERVLSKSNSVVTFLGIQDGNVTRWFGEITCGYVVRNLVASYVTNYNNVANKVQHFEFNIGTDGIIPADGRFKKYLSFTIDETVNYKEEYHKIQYRCFIVDLGSNLRWLLQSSDWINLGKKRDNKESKIVLSIDKVNNSWGVTASFYINNENKYSARVSGNTQVTYGNNPIFTPNICGEEGLFIYGDQIPRNLVLNCNINCNTDYNIPKQ